ncbi:MAG: TerC family protein [Pseudomonadota bacterium]
MEILQSPIFWVGLVKIIWINIILSGDNAVVVALAARALPAHQQKKAILWGSGAAVLMRIGLTVVAVRLLALAFLQIIGGLLLFWIGIQLLGDEAESSGETGQQGTLMSAIRTILIADLVMSLDNVIAVAAAAQGSTLLLIIGLAISIPLVIFGSTLMIKLMARFPFVITLGAALIGWVAGETIIGDAAWRGVLEVDGWVHYAAAAAGATLVVGAGKFLQWRSQASHKP